MNELLNNCISTKPCLVGPNYFATMNVNGNGRGERKHPASMTAKEPKEGCGPCSLCNGFLPYETLKYCPLCWQEGPYCSLDCYKKAWKCGSCSLCNGFPPNETLEYSCSFLTGEMSGTVTFFSFCKTALCRIRTMFRI